MENGTNDPGGPGLLQRLRSLVPFDHRQFLALLRANAPLLTSAMSVAALSSGVYSMIPKRVMLTR